MKYDEKKLWEYALQQWERVKDLPEGTGERIVSIWHVGEYMGIHKRRIENIADKWHRQGKWVKLGTMTGTDIVTP